MPVLARIPTGLFPQTCNSRPRLQRLPDLQNWIGWWLEMPCASGVVRRREPQTLLCPLTSQQANTAATMPMVSAHREDPAHRKTPPTRSASRFRRRAQWHRHPGDPVQGQQRKRPDKLRRATAGFSPVRPPAICGSAIPVWTSPVWFVPHLVLEDTEDEISALKDFQSSAGVTPLAG